MSAREETRILLPGKGDGSDAIPVYPGNHEQRHTKFELVSRTSVFDVFNAPNGSILGAKVQIRIHAERPFGVAVRYDDPDKPDTRLIVQDPSDCPSVEIEPILQVGDHNWVELLIKPHGRGIMQFLNMKLICTYLYDWRKAAPVFAITDGVWPRPRRVVEFLTPLPGEEGIRYRFI